MPTVYDVTAYELIKKISKSLKENSPEIIPPEWAKFVKTSVHLELPPKDKDWWYIRCASVLRKIYLNKVIGVRRLKGKYGGRSRRGVVGEHKKDGSGSITRKILQQLEKAELVKIVDKKGRSITIKGQALLDNLATEIIRDLEKKS